MVCCWLFLRYQYNPLTIMMMTMVITPICYEKPTVNIPLEMMVGMLGGGGKE